MYLVALIDVYSRYIVSWSLSNTMETGFCMDALKKALIYAHPEVINSNQGSQFTSDDWVDFLKEWNIDISMTGKGQCHDNVYIERFWRSFKTEKFYLNEFSSVRELRYAIEEYVKFYNQRRWHQSLDYKVPAEVNFEQERRPVDMWTRPSDQSVPFGMCVQAMDNTSRIDHILHTITGFAPT